MIVYCDNETKNIKIIKDNMSYYIEILDITRKEYIEYQKRNYSKKNINDIIKFMKENKISTS